MTPSGWDKLTLAEQREITETASRDARAREFYGVALRDPMTAMLQRMWVEVWAEAYRRGWEDSPADIYATPPPSGTEIRDMAQRALTAEDQDAAEQILALAALSPAAEALPRLRAEQARREHEALYGWPIRRVVRPTDEPS